MRRLLFQILKKKMVNEIKKCKSYCLKNKEIFFRSRIRKKIFLSQQHD